MSGDAWTTPPVDMFDQDAAEENRLFLARHVHPFMTPEDHARDYLITRGLLDPDEEPEE